MHVGSIHADTGTTDKLSMAREIVAMISVSLNLLRFVFCPGERSVHTQEDRVVCCCWAECSIMPVNAICSQVYFQVHHFLVDYSLWTILIADSKVLKSSTIVVLSPGSPLRSYLLLCISLLWCWEHMYLHVLHLDVLTPLSFYYNVCFLFISLRPQIILLCCEFVTKL